MVLYHPMTKLNSSCGGAVAAVAGYSLLLLPTRALVYTLFYTCALPSEHYSSTYMYLVILYIAISIEGDLMILPTNILLDLDIFINVSMISATTNQLKLMIIFIK
jgi:hypothetical protein